MGYNDLGDFHYARGDLQQAFKCFVRTRDYCTTSKHIISMCLNVILVAIDLGHFAHVSNYVTKADQTPDSQEPQVIAKLRVDAGLAYLESKKYKMAARKVKENIFLWLFYVDHSYMEDLFYIRQIEADQNPCKCNNPLGIRDFSFHHFLTKL